MRKQHNWIRAAKILTYGVLFLAAAAGLALVRAPERPGPWSDSTYRNFGAPQRLTADAVLLDESDDPELRSALAAELSRLSVELFEKEGWRVPFAPGDPLRVLVARREADGVRRLVARSVDGGRLVLPTIQIDGTDLSDGQIVRETARLFALAAISGYGVPDHGFMTTAAAELLSGAGDSPEEIEAAREVASAPSVRLADHARTMGGLFLGEFAREAGGPAALRLVWERASERGEEPLASLGQVYAEITGEKEDALFLRFAARLYTSFETEPAPSQIRLFDLETGAFDASAPAPFTFRHRTYLPVESGGALRVRWPAEAGEAAAVVRYRDPALPPDVLFLEPGSVHAVPLAGVFRVDWVVAGGSAPGPVAPAFFETLEGFPFAGLSPHAVASTEGPRVWWTTSSHEGLAGWAIFREEVLPDGQIARTGPEILPASSAAAESFRYAYVDPGAAAGTYYRYSVWAVTEDGLLARAFSATLRTPE